MGKKTLMFLNTDENIKIFILFDTSNDIVVLNFDVWRVKCACMPWGVVALCAIRRMVLCAVKFIK
jgi:hypothetical protein